MPDPQDPSRREAIRYLIAGAVTAACPVALSATDRAAQAIPSTLGSENNVLCHKVRDGAEFKFPAPSAEYDVIIIGGGPSGLMSAYRLHDTNFLLLEKEPRLGGNAISEQWNGQWYSTGAAYTGDADLLTLCREVGMPIYRIDSVDAAVINGKLVPEFWKGGLWNSPYPEPVKKSFARFHDDMKALDLEKNAAKLDGMTFADLLKPYGPEVKAWFDNFGPNNWGADTENSSALIGADTVNWGGGIEPDRYTWPGGLGRISLALEEKLSQLAPGRLRKQATVLQAAQQGSKVQVSYSENGEIKTAAARAAIIACPKFIARHIIRGLDDDHLQAMSAMRYAPYIVANVCSRQVIYNGSFDTNIPAPSPIVDFNVADWVINRDNKQVDRPAVLTCYLPQREANRVRLLEDDYVRSLGEPVVALLEQWFPGAKAKIEEVHLYRRGHPMFMAAPGVLTRLAPRIRKPMGNIFFAHSDSEGGVSEYGSALKAANRVNHEVRQKIGSSSDRVIG